MTSKRLNRIRRQNDNGVAAVEFALVLPLLLLIIFGIIDFARAYNAQQAVTAAAREAIRAKALGHPESIQTRADEGAGFTVTVSSSGADCTSTANAGMDTKVTVTYTFNFATPLPAFVPGLGDTLTLTGKGDMACGG